VAQVGLKLDDEFEDDVVLAHAVKVWFPSLSPV
jgi:hypothetical protein